MTISRTHTTSYATLEVSQEAFDDVKARLTTAGVLDEYKGLDESRELLVLGAVALAVEPPYAARKKTAEEIEEIRKQIATKLNEFPEVAWDRWSGTLGDFFSVFGWIERGDGKSDFVHMNFDEDGKVWYFTTSSARYSAEFCKRAGMPGHSACTRVELNFPEVRAVKL